MKKILILTFLLLTSLGFSQILNPVQWELGVEQQSKTELLLFLQPILIQIGLYMP
jgi:hypothetical protein